MHGYQYEGKTLSNFQMMVFLLLASLNQLC